MPDNYGDHRDTQRRWMHRPAPHHPDGFESKLFGAGEVHNPADGWTHLPADAIARGKSGHSKPVAAEDKAEAPKLPEPGTPASGLPDDEEEGTAEELKAALSAMKRPALVKMAAELGITFDMTWKAEQFREAILKANLEG